MDRGQDSSRREQKIHGLFRFSTLKGMSASGNLPPWCSVAGRRFISQISDSHFPCSFATGAMKQDLLHAVFVDAFCDSFELSRIFTEYHRALTDLPDDKAALTALIVFFQPAENPSKIALEEYHRESWALLRRLSAADPSPWPDNIPRDAHDPLFAFCFGGEPWFINISTPMNIVRRSRNLGGGVVWIAQPLSAFKKLFKASSKKQAAQALIRNRCVEYDGITASPDLGNFGDSATPEVLTYGMLDSNESSERASPWIDAFPGSGSRCPFARLTSTSALKRVLCFIRSIFSQIR